MVPLADTMFAHVIFSRPKAVTVVPAVGHGVGKPLSAVAATGAALGREENSGGAVKPFFLAHQCDAFLGTSWHCYEYPLRAFACDSIAVSGGVS